MDTAGYERTGSDDTSAIEMTPAISSFNSRGSTLRQSAEKSASQHTTDNTESRAEEGGIDRGSAFGSTGGQIVDDADISEERMRVENGGATGDAVCVVNLRKLYSNTASKVSCWSKGMNQLYVSISMYFILV